MSMLDMRLMFEERRAKMLGDKLLKYREHLQTLKDHSYNCFSSVIDCDDFAEIRKHFKELIRETQEQLAETDSKVAFLLGKKTGRGKPG